MNPSERTSQNQLDLLIQGGTVLDGTGADPVIADIGIRDERLVVGDALVGLTALRTIDATGLYVAPGFIDIHAHSDFNALLHPGAESKILSGVTTEVSGNCGYGAFPLLGEVLDRRRAEYEPQGLTISWTDADEYFACAEATPCSLNRIILLGHGNVRGAVLGYADARADTGHLRQMTRFAEQAFEAGAWGISSGLIYAPGMYADRDELIALARVAAEHGGLYASHIRGEGAPVLDAVDEFLDIVRTSGARGQLSHVKVTGRSNWHLFDDLKRKLFDAYESGVDFLADRYPYIAASTDLASTVLPGWALAGSLDQILDRLGDPATLRRIEQELARDKDPDFAEYIMICDVRAPDWSDAMGRRLSELAADYEGSAVRAACQLILADQAQTTCVNFVMDEDQLRDTLTWPFVMIGSDGSIHGEIGPDSGQHCHPRAYGTPARVLGTYVRETATLDWATAIYKLTGLPARSLRLTDRGRLDDGLAADVTVFDPNTVADQARYDCPSLPPTGIEWVIVNGQIVVHRARHTYRYPGRLLRPR